MSFELSDPPRYLEISDPSNTLLSQTDTIGEHHTHWANAYGASASEVDLGMHVINAAFLTSFNEALTDMEQPGPNPVESLENIRVFMSGLLAMSGLVRRLVAHPTFKARDARADQKAPHILSDTNDGTPCFHMVHEAYGLILPKSDNPDQWYRDGGLFVRRTIPAELSLERQQKLNSSNMQVDPADMATLYPFLGRN